MEKLNCKFCQRLSDEFTILNCDHVVCAQCYWGKLIPSLLGTETIRCLCGESTTFPGKSIKSRNATTNHSREASPRKIKKSSQYCTSISRVKQSSQSLSRLQTSMNLGKDALGRQLQFLNLQFRKSIEQLQSNFNMIVQSMQKRYQNLVQNIRLFWLEEIVQHDTLHMLNLSKMLERKYHKTLGHKLKNLNEHLLDNIVGYRIETQNSTKLIYPKTKPSIKENQQSALNLTQENDQLFSTIQRMKEDSRGLRKIVKKSGKYKFL